MLNFGFLDMLQHFGKLGSIHALELSNLDFKMVILMFSGSNHFCLPLHLSSAKLNICGNFCLSLQDSNCCSKFFKMVLLSPFRNRIKRGDHWTLKSLFNNVLFLMDDIHSFSGSSYHSTHAFLCVICHSNHSGLFYFLSQKIL